MAGPGSPVDSSEVLFFIPDIGGFTKFVSETEIRHSQHIIQELLELLVDANNLGLEVAEFEGDAVLFVRSGAPPSVDALIEQARAMFVAFHAHLRRIEYYRVCQCGACSTASSITLKIVAHAGSAATMKVKDQRKFIGKDIIVAHRLLKNSVPTREYLLVTEATLDRVGAAGDALSDFAGGSNAYDELGDISYRYKPLDGYLSDVRVDPPKPASLDNPVRVLRLEQRIEAPADRVYQMLIDLPARMQWIAGIKSVQMSDDEPNHIGKVHRCVSEGGGDPQLVTSAIEVRPDTMALWETDVAKHAACRYLVTRLPGAASEIAVEFYVQGNALMRLLFRTFARRKLKARFEQSLRKLASVCEALPAG
jgi:hypothetical protein